MIIQLNLSFQIDNTILLSNKENARTKGRVRKFVENSIKYFFSIFVGEPSSAKIEVR